MRRGRPARASLPPGFGTIWTSVAIDLVGWGIVLPILPLYSEEFTDSETTIGLLVAVFSVMQLVFAPVWGRVSDRVGRKPVIVVSLAGTAIGSLLMGVAWSLPILFAGRIIDGISGGSISAAHAAVVDIATPEERPRLLGLLGAAFGVGFVVGPAIGALAALGGDAVPFFVAAAIAAVNAVVAIKRLPETRPLSRSRDESGAFSDRIGPENRGLWRLLAITLVGTTAFTAFEATFALLGERRFDLTEAGVGATFAVVGIALAVFQGGFVHRVVTRLGEVATIRAGLVVNAAGFVLIGTAETWAPLIAGLGLLIAGQGMLSPSLTSLIAGGAGDDRRGSTLGMQQSAGALARIVGPIAGLALFEHVGIGAAYVLAAALALVAVGLTVDVSEEVTVG